MTDWKERAEKAEARVAVLREALKQLADPGETSLVNKPVTEWAKERLIHFQRLQELAAGILATEDQAAEALLAELKHLRGIVWGDHPRDVNKMCAEIDGLKAQLDVAVEALKDQHLFYGCPEAAAALAKLKEAP